MATAMPQTPPQTPQHPKLRSSPSRRHNIFATATATPGSSSSRASSIHPTETISPSKPPIIPPTVDTVRVEELVEGDPGYITDIDVVHPAELEELDSDSDGDSCGEIPENHRVNNDHEDEDEEGEEDVSEGLSRRLSRLGYCDGSNRKAEEKFYDKRSERRRHAREEARAFKRSHSRSVKSETEEDADPGDRRVKRRVRGPVVSDVVYEGVAATDSTTAGAPGGNLQGKRISPPRFVGQLHEYVERRDRRLTPDGSESDDFHDDKHTNDDDHDDDDDDDVMEMG